VRWTSSSARCSHGVEKPAYVVLASDHAFTPTPTNAKYIGTHDLAGIYLVQAPDLRASRRGSQHRGHHADGVYLLDLPVADDMTGRSSRKCVTR